MQCAWNSAHIDDIDAPYCVADVGNSFKSTLDFEIITEPTLYDYRQSILSQ